MLQWPSSETEASSKGLYPLFNCEMHRQRGTGKQRYRYSLTDHERVNVIRAFVSFDCFQIAHVAHDRIFVHDAVRAQQIADSRAHSSAIATLFLFSIDTCAGQGDRCPSAVPACSASSCAFVISVIMSASFLLHELMGGDRTIVELLAVDRVLPCCLVAVHRCPDNSPPDSIARLCQASESRLQTLWRREHIDSGMRQSVKLRLDVTDIRIDSFPCRSDELKARSSAFNQESLNARFVRAHTTAMSATQPFVIHVFSPFSTHPVASRGHL